MVKLSTFFYAEYRASGPMVVGQFDECVDELEGGGGGGLIESCWATKGVTVFSTIVSECGG